MLSFEIMGPFVSVNNESFLTDRKTASNQAWLPNNKLVKQLHAMDDTVVEILARFLDIRRALSGFKHTTELTRNS